MKGFVLLVVIEAEQAKDDHSSVVRICHDFDADTLADLETAITHASISAKRQLRHVGVNLRSDRAARDRRATIRAANG